MYVGLWLQEMGWVGWAGRWARTCRAALEGRPGSVVLLAACVDWIL